MTSQPVSALALAIVAVAAIPPVTAANPVTQQATTTAFQAPADFHEFFEREPSYVKGWLRSVSCPRELAEDYEQSLLLHLLRPVHDQNTGAEVSTDRIAHYNPARMGGATSANAFYYYLNGVLIKEYGKLINRTNRGGVRGTNVVSLTPDVAMGDDPNQDLPGILRQDTQFLDRIATVPVDVPTQVFVHNFLDYLTMIGATAHRRYLEAFAVADNREDLMRLTGFTRAQCDTLRRRLKTYAADYAKFGLEG